MKYLFLFRYHHLVANFGVISFIKKDIFPETMQTKTWCIRRNIQQKAGLSNYALFSHYTKICISPYTFNFTKNTAMNAKQSFMLLVVININKHHLNGNQSLLNDTI